MALVGRFTEPEDLQTKYGRGRQIYRLDAQKRRDLAAGQYDDRDWP